MVMKRAKNMSILKNKIIYLLIVIFCIIHFPIAIINILSYLFKINNNQFNFIFSIISTITIAYLGLKIYKKIDVR